MSLLSLQSLQTGVIYLNFLHLNTCNKTYLFSRDKIIVYFHIKIASIFMEGLKTQAQVQKQLNKLFGIVFTSLTQGLNSSQGKFYQHQLNNLPILVSLDI